MTWQRPGAAFGLIMSGSGIPAAKRGPGQDQNLSNSAGARVSYAERIIDNLKPLLERGQLPPKALSGVPAARICPIRLAS